MQKHTNMKKTIISIFSFLLLSSFVSFQAKKENNNYFERISQVQSVELGKKLFIKNGCNLCHHEHKEGLAPMLKDISKIYNGDKDRMEKFLKRESDPIVRPKDFGIMSANLFKTKKMKDEEIKALIAYMLSIK